MAFHIIGDQDTVLGFRFAGTTGAAVETQEQARDALTEALGDKRCQILLLTEVVEDMLESEVTKHRLTAAPPYIVVVSDIAGTPFRRKNLEQTIQEAVGIRIVSSED